MAWLPQWCVQDTCQGDSGGPLWTLVRGRAVLIGAGGRPLPSPGLVSRGRGCARANYPGIYTRRGGLILWLSAKLSAGCRVKKHLSWIYAHTRTPVRYTARWDIGSGPTKVPVRGTRSLVSKRPCKLMGQFLDHIYRRTDTRLSIYAGMI
jgi:hypothetical protein